MNRKEKEEYRKVASGICKAFVIWAKDFEGRINEKHSMEELFWLLVGLFHLILMWKEGIMRLKDKRQILEDGRLIGFDRRYESRDPRRDEAERAGGDHDCTEDQKNQADLMFKIRSVVRRIDSLIGRMEGDEEHENH